MSEEKSLIQQSTELDILLNESGGEITQEIETRLMSLATKADGAAYVLDRLTKAAEFYNQRAMTYAKMSAAAAHATERLQTYIFDSMKAGHLKELTGKEFRFAIQKSSPRVEVHAEAMIPDEFIVTTTTRRPDKLKIKDALKRGESVPGCSLAESESLRRYTVKP